MWRGMSHRPLSVRCLRPLLPLSRTAQLAPLTVRARPPPLPPAIFPSSSLSLTAHPSCCYATSGDGRSSHRGSHRRRRSASASASSSSQSSFSSPSLLLALLRSLPSATRARLLLGGGLLFAVCGGLVVLFVSALPYLILPLLGVWLARRAYRWYTLSAWPRPPTAPFSAPSHFSSSSPSPSFSPFRASSVWSELLSSPLSALSSLSSSFDAAVSRAIAHPRVVDTLGCVRADGVVESELDVEVWSQQARVVDDRVSGQLVLHVSNARTGRGVQLEVDFVQLSADGSLSDSMRLTRLCMQRDGSGGVEELPVNEDSSTTQPSRDDVIDVQWTRVDARKSV